MCDHEEKLRQLQAKERVKLKRTIRQLEALNERLLDERDILIQAIHDMQEVKS